MTGTGLLADEEGSELASDRDREEVVGNPLFVWEASEAGGWCLVFQQPASMGYGRISLPFQYPLGFAFITFSNLVHLPTWPTFITLRVSSERVLPAAFAMGD